MADYHVRKETSIKASPEAVLASWVTYLDTRRWQGAASW